MENRNGNLDPNSYGGGWARQVRRRFHGLYVFGSDFLLTYVHPVTHVAFREASLLSRVLCSSIVAKGKGMIVRIGVSVRTCGWALVWLMEAFAGKNLMRETDTDSYFDDSKSMSFG